MNLLFIEDTRDVDIHMAHLVVIELTTITNTLWLPKIWLEMAENQYIV